MSFSIQSGYLAGFDGTQIHYTLTNPAVPTAHQPVLVFCNGVGMDASIWTHSLAYFRKTHCTLSWEYRGHGISERPKKFREMKLADHCRDLDCLLRELNLHHVVLLGHSMGVQVILEFYRLFSQSVQGLVAVCGHYENPLGSALHTPLLKYVFPSIFQFTTRNAKMLNPLWRQLARSRIAKEVALFLGTNRSMLSQDDFLPYFRNLSNLDLEFYFYALKAACEHSAKGVLPIIKVPCLVIAGEWDHFTPLAAMRVMAEQIPQAEFLIIPQGSHCGLLDQPELFNLKTENFLGRFQTQAAA